MTCFVDATRTFFVVFPLLLSVTPAAVVLFASWLDGEAKPRHLAAIPAVVLCAAALGLLLHRVDRALPLPGSILIANVMAFIMTGGYGWIWRMPR